MSKQNAAEGHLDTMGELYREYVVLFLAELMQVTGPPEKQEEFLAALQAYCDSLLPWLEPSDCPANPRDVFSLLEECAFDTTEENVVVVLSPEAEAIFRAWLRRNKIWSDEELNSAHACSN
jgi:hypothetical protein